MPPTLSSTLFLSCGQWNRYRRFPCKLLLHLILVIVLTLHCVRYVDIVSPVLFSVCAGCILVLTMVLCSMGRLPNHLVLLLQACSFPRIICSTQVGWCCGREAIR